jgi:hypothetical protein
MFAVRELVSFSGQPACSADLNDLWEHVMVASLTGRLSLARAEQLMEDNVLGPAEVVRHFGVKLSKSQLQELREVPFSARFLEVRRKSHVLVAGFPLSVSEIRKKHSQLFLPKFSPFAGEHATETRVRFGWYLLRRDLVAGSLDMGYQRQRKLLDAHEQVPWLREVVYATALGFLARNIRIFQDHFVRCRDKLYGPLGQAILRFEEPWIVIFDDIPFALPDVGITSLERQKV